jgi:hypothetical protein
MWNLSMSEILPAKMLLFSGMFTNNYHKLCGGGGGVVWCGGVM